MKTITVKRTDFTGIFYSRNLTTGNITCEEKKGTYYSAVKSTVSLEMLTGLHHNSEANTIEGFIDKVQYGEKSYFRASMSDDRFLAVSTENEEGRDYYPGEINRTIPSVSYTILYFDLEEMRTGEIYTCTKEGVKEAKAKCKELGYKVLKVTEEKDIEGGQKRHIPFWDFVHEADTLEPLTLEQAKAEATEE